MASNCTDCVNPIVVKQEASGCGASKPKIEDVRLYCCEETVETYSPSTNTNCTIGYISDLVAADPILNPTPLKFVETFNTDELDELNDYTFDRTEDFGEDTWSITLGVKLYNDDHDCWLKQIKGQDVCLVYRIENQSGDWVWRRFKGKVTGVTGGRLAGYQITIDNVDPADADIPMYVNFGTADLTDTGLDAITEF